jgi:hypothetical protein
MIPKHKLLIVFAISILFGCKRESKDYIIFDAFSPDNNIALNRSFAPYPNALESDDGWGGAFCKNHLTDGLRNREIYWNYGFAFTGGLHNYVDTCGWRQAVINFGRTVSFNRVVIWRNDGDVLTKRYYLQYFNTDSSKWINIKVVLGGDSITKVIRNKFFDTITDYSTVWATEDTFRTVESDKFRLYLNNCDVELVWLTEIEVYHDKPGDRPKCLVIK